MLENAAMATAEQPSTGTSFSQQSSKLKPGNYPSSWLAMWCA